MKKFCWAVCLGWVLWAQAAWASDNPTNIVFIPKSSDQVFWDIMRRGVDEAVREAGNVSLTWRGPAYNDDTDAQIRILELYTRPGVDAIVIAPTDRARLAAPVAKAVDQGIHVVVVDSAVDGDRHQNFITTDNIEGGKIAAQHMMDLLNKQGRVVVFRTVAGSASTEDRAKGFLAHLKAHAPQMKVVLDTYGGGSRGKALYSASALLKTMGPVDGIFTVNESATDGMVRALRGVKLNQKIKLVGFDSTDFLIEALEKQDIHGLVIQNPQQMGYLGIKAAVAAVKKQPMKEKNLFTEAKLVTRSNHRDPTIKKLMCSNC